MSLSTPKIYYISTGINGKCPVCHKPSSVNVRGVNCCEEGHQFKWAPKYNGLVRIANSKMKKQCSKLDGMIQDMLTSPFMECVSTPDDGEWLGWRTKND